MAKSLALTFVMMMALSSLLRIEPTFAQTPTPTPYPTTFSSTIAIPEFTIQLADHSYDAPPTTTTTIDPYTGQQITTTQPGHHVENKTIDFTIINQPHVSVFIQYQYGIDLYYDVRFKGHFGDTWTELHTYDESENLLPIATNSTYTPISIPQSNYSSNASVDFQIRAINGTIHADYPGIVSPFAHWTYEASGWSNIETINMTDGSVSITPYTNPTPTPTQTPEPTSPPTPTATPISTPTPAVPEMSWLAILPLMLSVFSVAMLVRHRKNR